MFVASMQSLPAHLSFLSHMTLISVQTLPTHLSELSRDLIPRMLVVDPLKRITIPEIRAHPWFK